MLDIIASFILMFFCLFGAISFAKITFEWLFCNAKKNSDFKIGNNIILQEDTAEYVIREALLRSNNGVIVNCDRLDEKTLDIVYRLALENNRLILCQDEVC